MPVKLPLTGLKLAQLGDALSIDAKTARARRLYALSTLGVPKHLRPRRRRPASKMYVVVCGGRCVDIVVRVFALDVVPRCGAGAQLVGGGDDGVGNIMPRVVHSVDVVVWWWLMQEVRGITGRVVVVVVVVGDVVAKVAGTGADGGAFVVAVDVVVVTIAIAIAEFYCYRCFLWLSLLLLLLLLMMMLLLLLSLLLVVVVMLILLLVLLLLLLKE